MVKPSSLQAFAHCPALVRSKCGFENRIKNTFFIRSVSAYRELLIAAVLVVTIVQHRTSVLDITACVCSKTSRVEHTKSVHNRPKPAVFVRTALGLSSNQNEVAINSKLGLWRTALLTKGKRKVPETHIVFIAGVLIDLIKCNSLRGGQGIHFLYKSFTLYHFTKE